MHQLLFSQHGRVHDFSALPTSSGESTRGTDRYQLAPLQQPAEDVLPGQGTVSVKKELDRPHSKYAYVTLISGIDEQFKYRGFLYNALIIKTALAALGSTMDVIALIGYSQKNIAPFESDMELLRTHGVRIHVLPRLLDERFPLQFAEMALLKITPFSFTEYEKIQFFDGDVMPTRNMDCFFELDSNAFTVGAVSPLNSGWYLGKPDMKAFAYMKERAIWRLGRDWDTENGWGEKMPAQMFYRGGKVCERWQFNGADMDQGLFTHYFVINHGNTLLLDTQTKQGRYFKDGIKYAPGEKVSVKDALKVCNGISPVDHFSHFTGRSKPWMLDLSDVDRTNKNGDLVKWKNYLNGLHLENVNSSTIGDLKYGAPLGFFNANFPRGGFNKANIK